MDIQQGDKYRYLLPNGLEATIEVVDTIGDKVAFKHIHGKSGVGSVHVDYFQQLVGNGYFEKVEK